MAEALIEVVLESLNSLIQREIGLLWGVHEEMEKLSDTFSTIKVVIEDAELQQHREPIKHWLRKLKQTAYEVDDILDDCATEATRLEFKVPASFLTCYSSHGNILFRRQIGSKIKDINAKLDAIANDRTRFELREISVVERVAPARWRQTMSTLTESHVFGREADHEYVVAQIVKHAIDSEDLSVLPIIGMGGLGKTTLAQLVFSDDRVVEHFELRIWVCVSDEDFDVKRIIKAIMESVCKGACEDVNLDTLQRRLREKLNGKRYLLVLDDVWNENQQYWDDLKGVLNCGERGASVIVTTRLQIVASIMGTLPQRRLSILSEDDCWSVFEQRAFGPEREESEQLVAIGKEIVKKCGGVPLAAKTLGSLMRFKATEQEWQKVKESEIWDLPQEENSILPALRLSYVNLPVELRQCFAYCSVFPKDSVLIKEEVIQQWMANGFTRSYGNLDLEDIGDEIWRELQWRSFFEEVKNDEFGDIYSFKMHDLVHDLATSVVDDQYKHPGRLQKKGNLRTLIGKNMEYRFKFIPKDLRSLRVLSVGRSSWLSKLGNLKHLRYLNFSGGLGFTSLPNSICNLVNLQTLNLNGSRSLQKLPRHITRLGNLRHLYLNHCDKLRYMAPGIGQLKNLKTLTHFMVDRRRGCGLEELKHLNLGGQLVIQGLGMAGKSGAVIYLAGKQNLRKLKLEWYGSQENIDHLHTLEALQPHPNLRSLTIGGYGGSSFPSWMRNIPTLQNLRTIKFSLCKHCVHLPPIGQLPVLEHLYICEMDLLRYVDDADFLGGVASASRFPSLKILTIGWSPCLEKLSTEEGRDACICPCLSKLSIYGCPKLSLPCLWSLKEFYVRSCSNALLSSISSLTHLTSLALEENEEEVCFPEGMLRNLTALHSLRILNFKKLQVLPTELENLGALKSLSIKWCPALESLPGRGIQGLFSLQHLEVISCPQLKSLPESTQCLTALQSLVMNRLSGLASLPDGLGKLTSLQSLYIYNCPEVASLPDTIQSLTNLKTLKIGECPQLERRYHKERGEEYYKIAHIPSFSIR